MNGPHKILVPKERIFERTQGCWNCSNSSSANAFWSERRLHDLTRAQGIANDSPDGEKDIKVDNIKRMVDTTDHAIASGALMRCTKGVTANGDPVGDLVAHNYLCQKWSGMQGASIARAGQKADDLPEELADKLDGSAPNPRKPSITKPDN